MNRARERVRDDAALVGEVASKVSAALGLDKANRTLGRNLVIAGLDANIAAVSAAAAASEDDADIGTDAGAAIAAAAAAAAAAGRGRGSDADADAELERTGEAAFRTAAKGYGALGNSLLSDVFGKVTTRLRGSLVQLQAMQEEESGGATEEDSSGGLAGFGKAERLSSGGAGRALKGGLVKRHTFQVRRASLALHAGCGVVDLFGERFSLHIVCDGDALRCITPPPPVLCSTDVPSYTTKEELVSDEEVRNWVAYYAPHCCVPQVSRLHPAAYELFKSFRVRVDSRGSGRCLLARINRQAHQIRRRGERLGRVNVFPGYVESRRTPEQ